MVVRPAAGGMKEHVLALSVGLAALGHEVHIAAPRGGDVYAASHQARIETHDIPLVGPLNPPIDIAAVAALRRLIAAGDFDLVHAHGFKAGLVGRLAARFGGRVPFVITAHNHVLERDETSGAAKARHRAAERALAGYVTAYIAVSESIRRELLEGYGLVPERVVTIHNGIDAEPFLVPHDHGAVRSRLGLPPDGPLVGLAARFSSQKGLRHLIAALPELRRSRPDVVAVVAGTGPLEGALREQAVALGVSGSVCWPGHIDDVPSFLSALDVYVSPAETEALGMGLIEASAAALPIVATRVGGVSEVVVDGVTGLLVAPRDPSALVAGVLELLGDPERARALATAARERAISEFGVERMVRLTEQTYAAVTTPKARRP
jgi:glycosyltransferase involved in cell wall biosynthesis